MHIKKRNPATVGPAAGQKMPSVKNSVNEVTGYRQRVQRHKASAQLEPLEHLGYVDPQYPPPKPRPMLDGATAAYLIKCRLAAHLRIQEFREAWQYCDELDRAYILKQVNGDHYE